MIKIILVFALVMTAFGKFFIFYVLNEYFEYLKDVYLLHLPQCTSKEINAVLRGQCNISIYHHLYFLL